LATRKGPGQGQGRLQPLNLRLRRAAQVQQQLEQAVVGLRTKLSLLDSLAEALGRPLEVNLEAGTAAYHLAYDGHALLLTLELPSRWAGGAGQDRGQRWLRRQQGGGSVLKRPPASHLWMRTASSHHPQHPQHNTHDQIRSSSAIETHRATGVLPHSTPAPTPTAQPFTPPPPTQPRRFPEDKPLLSVQAARHAGSGEALVALRSCPWSPRWAPAEMATRLFNYVRAEVTAMMSKAAARGG
jgi:hypothetical protein